MMKNLPINGDLSTSFPDLSTEEYEAFRKFIYHHAGIELGPGKKTLVSSRLARRLRHYNLNSYTRYLKLAQSPENHEELQLLIDLLTTNETYFFRERNQLRTASPWSDCTCSSVNTTARLSARSSEALVRSSRRS